MIQWQWSPAPTAGSDVSSPRSCSSAAPRRFTPPRATPRAFRLRASLRSASTSPTRTPLRGRPRVAGDATLIINNAGISTGTSLMDGDLAQIELEMQTNFYGPLRVTRAFAPILASNGGGAILNVLSVISWLHLPARRCLRRREGRRVGDDGRRPPGARPPRHPRRRAASLPTWTRTWRPTSMLPRPTRLTSRRWRWTASRPTSPRSSPTTSPATSSRASRPAPAVAVA